MDRATVLQSMSGFFEAGRNLEFKPEEFRFIIQGTG